jgi:hypothetical protein
VVTIIGCPAIGIMPARAAPVFAGERDAPVSVLLAPEVTMMNVAPVSATTG